MGKYKKKKRTDIQKYRVETKDRQKIVHRCKPRSDYLKFYQVVIRYYMTKYNLRRADIETLFYLYSERLFSYNDIKAHINSIGNWDRRRLSKLIDDDWIMIWEKANGGMKSSIYELSLKGRRMVESFYRKLNGEEAIPTNYVNNPMFKKNNRFMDKVMIPKVWEFNEEYKKRLNQARQKEEGEE
jgi:hypothetical protein